MRVAVANSTALEAKKRAVHIKEWKSIFPKDIKQIIPLHEGRQNIMEDERSSFAR